MLAGMGGVSYSALAAAVSSAGGFGCLGAGTMSNAVMEAEISAVRAATDQPFAVDLLTAMPGSMREQVQIIIDGGATAFVAALGVPTEVIEQCHQAGVLVVNMCGKVEHAVRAVEAGCDLVVAQGTEAGGHTGEVSTMVLVPEVVDAVAPTPVLAAGGIGRGRQIAAAMALGAQGVWCGSVWLTTEEAETQPAVKEKFLAASSSDTVRSRSLTGKPARMLRSAWTDEWEKPDAPPTLPMPVQTILVAEAQARIARGATKTGSGSQQLANYFVGQVVGQLDRVRPARQVVLDMVEEYVEAAEVLARQVEV
jgi:NAD(P)H-dependent flavin oxidoreductase YrpB (nitropropane dioxygenase family)